MKHPLKHIVSDVDRHGRRRYYVRLGGRKARIREHPDTPEFLRAYTAAIEALKGGKFHGAVERTFGHLVTLYVASPEFQAMNAQSQKTRRSIIETCLMEPVTASSKTLMKDCPLSRINAAAVIMLRDRKAHLPGAANNRLKYLSAMFSWAVERNYLQGNPVRDVRSISYATDGFHSWTDEEVELFEATHPIGTKARLAFALLLYLGVRRGDVVRLGRQHVRGEVVRFTPSKTSYKRLDISQKPVLPKLREIIDASPCGDLTFLTTAYGKSFTTKGFGAWFKARCVEAGLPHCSAHGLRKAGARRAAEAGATVPQLMALYDWETSRQAEVYFKAANRAKMTAEIIGFLDKK